MGGDKNRTGCEGLAAPTMLKVTLVQAFFSRLCTIPARIHRPAHSATEYVTQYASQEHKRMHAANSRPTLTMFLAHIIICLHSRLGAVGSAMALLRAPIARVALTGLMP